MPLVEEPRSVHLQRRYELRHKANYPGVQFTCVHGVCDIAHVSMTAYYCDQMVGMLQVHRHWAGVGHACTDGSMLSLGYVI